MNENGADEMSVGYDVGSAQAVVFENGAGTGNWESSSTNSIDDRHTGGDFYNGNISSFDSDGFTFSWVRGSTPTGTIQIRYMAFR